MFIIVKKQAPRPKPQSNYYKTFHLIVETPITQKSDANKNEKGEQKK